jgi:Ser/Thr protein kinase RdoA (MazF antagonist)
MTDLRQITEQFQLTGDFLSATPLGNGHINDTYCVACRHGRFVLQRINHQVFRDPVALMDNVERVTAHLGSPQLIRARDGRPYCRDEAGNFWRMYNFIENARTFDTAESPRQAFEAAKAFGRFQNSLADLPAPRLRETIPDFHHTPKRFAALQQAIAADARNRALSAVAEIEFACRHEPMAGTLINARLPERTTHNDTKFNNVLFDDVTGVAVCVIDLDTVMPGLALHDFGDMVRSTTSPAAEDERDLTKVRMQWEMFEPLAQGYFEAAGSFLTKAERQLLAFSGKLITLEVGIRFLTDYLNGDTYFKVHRPDQNLDRCRTQFKLVESIEQTEERMCRLLETL